MTTFHIPATTDEGREYARARGWERAAWVWSWIDHETERKGGGDHRPENRAVLLPGQLSIKGFAAIGFHGLTHEDTVRRYHDDWQRAIDSGDAVPVTPGAEVALPTIPWPMDLSGLVSDKRRGPIEDQARADGVGVSSALRVAAASPGALAAAIKADERTADAARKALTELAEAQRRDDRLDVIAGGGRIPSLAEINANRPTSQIDPIVDMLREWQRVTDSAEQLIERLREFAPITGKRLDQVKVWAMELMDIAAAAPSTATQDR